MSLILQELKQIRKDMKLSFQLEIAEKTGWASRQLTQAILECERNKLQELIKAGIIEVNANPKQGRPIKCKYASIKKYLDNPPNA